MYQLRIAAKYSENYALHNKDYDGVPYWKPKGIVEFVVEVSDTQRMVMDINEMEYIMEKMLADQSNAYCKYELADYNFCDDKPKDLTKQFMVEFEARMVVNEQHAKDSKEEDDQLRHAID